MTLEEARELLGRIEEARRVVAEHEARQGFAWRSSECAEGRHQWLRTDPRARVPYCNHCGKEKLA